MGEGPVVPVEQVGKVMRACTREATDKQWRYVRGILAGKSERQAAPGPASTATSIISGPAKVVRNPEQPDQESQ
jgi:hypothetical protein